MSVLKIKDGNSWVEIPASGAGVPQGGNAGEVLTKASSTDYDAGWVLPLSMKLLWTNSSPTASFAAQTVSLDLSSYQMVMVLSVVGGDDLAITHSITPVGERGRLFAMYNWRQVRVYDVSTTGITFQTGGESNQSGSITTHNQRAIPYQIYGIKGIT